MIKIIYGVAIIIGFASTAFAIHCIECESNVYSKCKDPFQADGSFNENCDLRGPPKYLQDANPGVHLIATGCLKQTFKFEGITNLVKRSCYWGEKDTTTGCQNDPSRPYLQQMSCDVCDTELCNSSTATGPLAAVIPLFVVLVRMIC